mmetsp:Transcript_40820/g.94690  ORF Transcript_40820/g.94690 Transcript_40820/m.94690 type:complete len:330 (+) Transcript_40820:47-1036(+)
MARSSGKEVRLQTGALPKQQRAAVDPHLPISTSMYRPANLRNETFERTTDAYMYDVLMSYFQRDNNFWNTWSIVDCAASVPDKHHQVCSNCGTAFSSINESVCRSCGHKRDQGRAPIRVVMDLPGMSELPRKYPPPPLGSNKDKPRAIPGLPSGYSVPLEAFTVEDGQMLLERQRMFNDGHIDPRYQWLQDIIHDYWEKKQANGETLENGSSKAKPKQKATSVKGFMSWLSGAVGVSEQTEDLPPLMGYGKPEPSFEEKNAAGQIGVQREGLVSPYDTQKVVAGPFRVVKATESAPEEEVQNEGSQLDADLEQLLLRTVGTADALKIKR